MAKNEEREILVYADWKDLEQPILMGILAATPVRGKEIFSFEYTEDWLEQQSAIYIDPNLQLYKGRQYLPDEKSNFGVFLDSSPDRWGRVLMKRREAILARKEDRREKTLFESDFLLGVYDMYRMGALRFKIERDGNFQNDNRDFATPPWASLRELEQASLNLEDEHKDDEESLKWLNLLIAPGSSLGGARPKASVVDEKGNLWIAKFPSINDTKDVGVWEMVVNELAIKAGINVAESRVQIFSGKQNTFITKRFDRTPTGERIHFASAMTLLGYTDGANYSEGVSYLEIAEFIIKYGANADNDLHELWRRIVFNICVSNTDDHLRNHGFLLTSNGWVLSPAYDINPVEKATGLTLNISESDNSLDLKVAIEVAEYFRLKKEKAEIIIKEVASSVNNWKEVAAYYHIPKQQIQLIQTAFGNF